MAHNPRTSTIPVSSGQPTKNLGATIINAGNTPVRGDSTNNNAGFGVLTGNNSGKGSGAKVVERSSPASSGIGGSTPGVQVASSKLEQSFASTTVGATIAKGLTTSDNQIGKATVGWKNIFRQYPTLNSPNMSTRVNQEYGGKVYPYDMDPIHVGYIKRGEITEFGSSVQITKRNAGGIIIAAGAPSGQAYQGVHATEESYARAGYVDTFEHNLEDMPGIPGEVGTITNEGFAQVDSEKCTYYRKGGGGHSSIDYKVCPGHLNGFQRIRNRLLYNNETYRASGAGDKRHTITASGAATGHSIAFNDDGSRMAVGMPYAQDEKGEVRVYELCTSPASGSLRPEAYWFRLGSQMTGNQKGDRFGWSVALDGVGNTMFAGAPKGAGGSGYVQLHELSGYGGSASWTQTAAACSSGVAAQDRYGYSVSCNGDGTAFVIGAPGGSGTRGYAQIFAYGGGNWVTTRRNKLAAFRQSQQASADNGKTKVQRIVGEASGERLGWSTDMMYSSEVPSSLGAAAAGKHNFRVAVGSPYWSSSVEGYDFSKRTFAERAAGVPIFDGVSIFSGAGGGFNPTENGLEFETKGLTSEGKVSCWGYSGESMLNTAKYGYAFLEYIQFGKSSSKEIMKGNYLSELGYSVKLSDEGDFLVAGAPGTDTSLPDDSDCKVKADASAGKDVTLPVEPITPPPVNPGDPCQPGILDVPTFGKNYALGTGAVRVYKYLWKGSDGDDARREHYREEEDYFIKYGATLKGIEVAEGYIMADHICPPQLHKNNHRYKRPNFQNFGQFDAAGDSPTYYHGERFGTSVSVFAQFEIGSTVIPQIVVGSPFAVDRDYSFSRCVFDFCTADESQSAFYNPGRTGRVDAYVALPTFERDNVMPLGAGRAAGAGASIMGTRTKPKLNFAPDGTPILGSGTAGGRESFFIAPNVSGSGLADDNALKSSRKTFGTGGINFTSSD